MTTLGNNIHEQSATTGTGSLTLAGADTGIPAAQTFDSQITDGAADVPYVIVSSGNQIEVGVGTFTSPATLSRDSVSYSSTGALLDLPAGLHRVFVDLSAGAVSDLLAAVGDAISLRSVALDASVGSPSDGDILVFRSAGGDWVLEAKPAGGSSPALADLTDVAITAVADDELLAYDATSGDWINQTKTEAGFGTAAVVDTGTAAGNIPVLDGSARMPAVDGSLLTNLPSGVSDHGALGGLGDDDHTQYHTDARGDARYSNLAHATRHASGGADAVKLDDLAAPDDNTDLDVSTSAHGLAPKAPNDSTKFLNGLGAWAVPPGASGLPALSEDTIWAGDATDTADEVPISAFGRSLIDDATALLARSTLSMGGVPLQGHISGLDITVDSSTGFTVGAGVLEVNGILRTISSTAITGISGLTASTPLFIFYDYDAAGTKIVYSQTAPVLRSANDPHQGWQVSGDATRRLIGWLPVGSGATLLTFTTCIRNDRHFKATFYAGGIRTVVSSVASNTAFSAIDLSELLPAICTSAIIIAKIKGTTAGDTLGLGIAPWDLGTAQYYTAPGMFKLEADYSAYLGPFEIAIDPDEAQTLYYRTSQVSGTPVPIIDCFGGSCFI